MIVALLAIPVALAAGEDVPPVEDLPLPDARPGRDRRPVTRFATSGFRTTTPVGDPAFSSRVALVQDFGGPTIGELTVRTQVGWRSFGFAAEIVGTAGASPLWSGAGLGNTVMDARWLFGRGSTHALGLRVTLPIGDRAGPVGPVAWWGTVPQATLPTAGVAIAYEGATERVVWHVHFGPRWGEWWLFGGGMIDAAASLAVIQPLAPSWELVAEIEAVSTQSPLHLRALARHSFAEAWTVDAGVAVPIVAFVRDPTLQLLARLERRW